MRDNVEDSLERSVGVKPSRRWLEACRSFLQENGGDNSADSILFQILHSDLRDVVRPIHDNDRYEQQQHL